MGGPEGACWGAEPGQVSLGTLPCFLDSPLLWHRDFSLQ